jgi:hypothetical protein
MDLVYMLSLYLAVIEPSTLLVDIENEEQRPALFSFNHADNQACIPLHG